MRLTGQVALHVTNGSVENRSKGLLCLVGQPRRHGRVEVWKPGCVEARALPGGKIPDRIGIVVEREPKQVLNKNLVRPKSGEHLELSSVAMETSNFSAFDDHETMNPISRRRANNGKRGVPRTAG